MSKPRVGIVGKGALGMLYGHIIGRTLGAGAAIFVMDDARYERHRNDVYEVNGVPEHFTDVRVSDAEPVDMVLVCVKSTGLEECMDLIEPLLGESTCIVPVLNGITSERKLAARFGWDRVVPCVAYAMDAARFGTSLEYSKEGVLCIGPLPNTPMPVVDYAADIFTQCGIEIVREQSILVRQWSKFMANVGINQTCAVYQATYEKVFSDETGEVFRSYIAATREALAVGIAEGVPLTEEHLNQYVNVLKGLDPNSMPSMAQDRVNRNLSEVDEFAGEIIRLAEKHAIYVPTNRYYLNQVQSYESEY